MPTSLESADDGKRAPRWLVGDPPRKLEFRGHVRQLVLSDLERREVLAELLAPLRVLEGAVAGSLRDAQLLAGGTRTVTSFGRGGTTAPTGYPGS